MYTENQEASNNFRLGFALSNSPHLHRDYLLGVSYSSSETVQYDLIFGVFLELLRNQNTINLILEEARLRTIHSNAFGKSYEPLSNP